MSLRLRISRAWNSFVAPVDKPTLTPWQPPVTARNLLFWKDFLWWSDLTYPTEVFYKPIAEISAGMPGDYILNFFHNNNGEFALVGVRKLSEIK